MFFQHVFQPALRTCLSAILGGFFARTGKCKFAQVKHTPTGGQRNWHGIQLTMHLQASPTTLKTDNTIIMKNY